MSRVSKKEDLFYGLLLDLARQLQRTGVLYQALFDDYPASVAHIPEAKRLETECDKMVGDLLAQLYESFITPFDREDLNALALKMDDVVDDMENIARRLQIYHVGTMRPEAVELAHLAREATDELELLFECFPNFKKDPQVMDRVHRIHLIEDHGDDVYHSAIARLYEENEAPATHLLKWNTIFNRMEDTIDAVKDVSSIVSSVVLKNA